MKSLTIFFFFCVVKPTFAAYYWHYQHLQTPHDIFINIDIETQHQEVDKVYVSIMLNVM